MKIAVVHVLPLEYYPPTQNMLRLLSQRRDFTVRSWTSPNTRNGDVWSSDSVSITRYGYTEPGTPLLRRVPVYGRWHWKVARDLADWKPDVLISVEPHSSPAVWLYFKILGGRARLFLHHYEFYAAEDYEAPGMRMLRAGRTLERALFNRAEWISQTNEDRLRLFGELHPFVKPALLRTIPNYPTREWVERARNQPVTSAETPVRFLYLGSASLRDTFLGEVARWIAADSRRGTLHVVGNNVSDDVWRLIRSLDSPSISTDAAGWRYEEIPERLSSYDVGLILYRGNTQNFVYNVPNKAIEYLAGNLEVWYPREMLGLTSFHDSYPELPMRMVDFTAISGDEKRLSRGNRDWSFPFVAESALAPLIDAIEQGHGETR